MARGVLNTWAVLRLPSTQHWLRGVFSRLLRDRVGLVRRSTVGGSTLGRPAPLPLLPRHLSPFDRLRKTLSDRLADLWGRAMRREAIIRTGLFDRPPSDPKADVRPSIVRRAIAGRRREVEREAGAAITGYLDKLQTLLTQDPATLRALLRDGGLSLCYRISILRANGCTSRREAARFLECHPDTVSRMMLTHRHRRTHRKPVPT